MQIYTDASKKVEAVMEKLKIDSSEYNINKIPNYYPPEKVSESRNIVSTVDVPEEIREEIRIDLGLENIGTGVCEGWTASDYRA